MGLHKQISRPQLVLSALLRTNTELTFQFELNIRTQLLNCMCTHVYNETIMQDEHLVLLP